VTAPTALILARVFGNSPDFWLNVQRRSDLWEAMHSPRERKRIERAKPLGSAACEPGEAFAINQLPTTDAGGGPWTRRRFAGRDREGPHTGNNLCGHRIDKPRAPRGDPWR
jgi:hypothetical protein